jgi:hypothetical protein
MNIPGMHLTSIRRLRELKIKESARGGDPPALPKIDPKHWPKTMDAMQDHFSTLLGETKAPLAYVIRNEAAVNAERRITMGRSVATILSCILWHLMNSSRF